MSGLKKYSYLAYIGPLWILSIYMNKTKDTTVTYHCNQGLMLFILEVLTLTVYILLNYVPAFGELLSVIFGFIAFPACLLYTVVGLLNVYNNRLMPLPYIGLIKIIR